jgi:hypothetical protein
VWGTLVLYAPAFLVIALALYRHKSVKEIVDSLDLALAEIDDRCSSAEVSRKTTKEKALT